MSVSKPPKPVIRSFELKVDEAEPGHTITPRLMFDQNIGSRAAGRIGHAAYAILRSQVLVAIPQLQDTLRTLGFALDQARLAAAENETQESVGELIKAGRTTHWEAITRLGIIVESLSATLMAYEAYCADPLADVASLLLRHELDLLKVLSEKKRRKLAYWEATSRMPSLEELTGYGLDPDEARAVRRGFRSAAFFLLGAFESLRRYYTPELHAVYLRFKHGYTLVAPGVSQLHLRLRDPRGSDLDEALRSGFAVIHQTRDGRRVLQVVRSSDEDLRSCLEVAHLACELASTVASTWLMSVEHPDGHTLQVMDPTKEQEPALLLSGTRKWAGDELAVAYNLDAVLEKYAETPVKAPLDSVLVESQG